MNSKSFARFTSIVTVLILLISQLSFAVAINEKDISLEDGDPFAIIAKSNIITFGNSTVTGSIGLSSYDAIDLNFGGTYTGTKQVGSDVARRAFINFSNLYEKFLTPDSNSIPLSGTLAGHYIVGKYESSTNLNLSERITLDGDGRSKEYLIFVTKNLNVTKNASYSLEGGIKPQNIYWIVTGEAKIDEDSKLVGNLICDGNISVGSKAIIEGRLISLDGFVQLNDNSVKPYFKDYASITDVNAQKIIDLKINSNTAYLNSDPVQLDSAPFIKNGHTYVPASLIAKMLNGTTSFTTSKKGKVETVTLNIDGRRINITIGDSTIKYLKNSEVYTLKTDAPAIISNDRTMLPFKAIADCIDAKTSFEIDDKSHLVTSVKMIIE